MRRLNNPINERKAKRERYWVQFSMFMISLVTISSLFILAIINGWKSDVLTSLEGSLSIVYILVVGLILPTIVLAQLFMFGWVLFNYCVKKWAFTEAVKLAYLGRVDRENA
jgi:hypothetical protein